MIVLGIADGPRATAAVLRDGSIVAAASEERFSRIKNDGGYPRRAVEALLAHLDVTYAEIDLVAVAGHSVDHFAVHPAETPLPGRVPGLAARLLGRSAPRGDMEMARRTNVLTHLGVAERRVLGFDHHACHAAAAYFGGPLVGSDPLVLTSGDSEDGLCATAARALGTKLVRREAAPSGPGSLGTFYSCATLALGMAFDHYDVTPMDVAPYASEPDTARAAAALRRVFHPIDAHPFVFAWTGRGPRDRQIFQATGDLRFDGIAGGAQRVLEEGLVAWAREMRQRYGGNSVAVSGGVFANPRATMALAAEEWVDDVFVAPSAGNESTAIGAAYLGYCRLCTLRGIAPSTRPLGPAYLGPGLENEDIDAALTNHRVTDAYRVTRPDDIERTIAELLAAGGVVARCAGRMELGSSGLGNRSILAHPAHRATAERLKRTIKPRGFWMPFAPSILHEQADKYLVNPKGLESPYMMLAFPTHRERRDDIAAAVHPYDGAARAHIVRRGWNPAFHALLVEFERRTGIGAVLNTSFNVPGEPIVCSADDALRAFERSDIAHLALGSWLISKKD
jgi:carbamoyltransferase